MKKLIVFASALALSGSMAFAMEEGAMDEDMMMEAPAPSVAVGGSAAIGIKNVDDDDETTEDFKLIREYKVTFDSTGTTDGGLMFGAGISIEDTHDDDPDKSVNGAKVYVGGADGSWKLQFGGNDPGIDLAGGFGVADDHFGGEDDESMALSGAFGDTSYRITAADPEAGGNADNDWSVGVSHSINTISVGVGMDSEDGLAIGVGTDLSGVSTFVYWSKSEFTDAIIVPAVLGDDGSVTTAAETGSQENTGLGVKASMSAGEGATFSVGYSTLKLEQMGADAQGNNGTAKTKLIEVDFSYDLGGGATLKASIDKEDAETLMSAESGTDATLNSTDKTTLEAAIAFSF